MLDIELSAEDFVVQPFRSQLLKWVGNKQRFAHEIAGYFPDLSSNTYFEPFLGSAAVLATTQPKKAFASDVFKPLIDIWITLGEDPDQLSTWYRERWQKVVQSAEPREAYEQIKASYNTSPNPADLLFLSRSCYGGIVRFRKSDGYMSTPMGAHIPISPESFDQRISLWAERLRGTEFANVDYRVAFEIAKPGDFIYCDPPYSHSQAILYGAQSFSLIELLDEIARAKSRGIKVALSIDGTKGSGKTTLDLPIPAGIFEREIFVNVGRSMLKRFQMSGKTLEDHVISDRLLLTY